MYNDFMYTHTHKTGSLLYSRNWHNIVNQLYFNKKNAKKKEVVCVTLGTKAIIKGPSASSISPFPMGQARSQAFQMP